MRSKWSVNGTGARAALAGGSRIISAHHLLFHCAPDCKRLQCGNVANVHSTCVSGIRQAGRASASGPCCGAALAPRPASLDFLSPNINIRGEHKLVQVNKETFMNRVRALLLGASMAALAASAFAADGPTVLLPADSTPALKLTGVAGESARITSASVTGQPFKTVLRIEVTKKPERPTDVLISTPIEAAMSAGDVLMVSFYMRSAGSGEATLDAGFRTLGASPQGPTGPPPAGPAPASRGQVPPGSPGRGGRCLFPGQPPLGAAAQAGPTWKKVTFPFALTRSEEHTSELQSRQYLVCRLLLEKKTQ